MTRTRKAQPSDAIHLARLRHSLWPEGSIAEHEADVEGILAGAWSATYAYAILVAEDEGGCAIGFAEVTLRSRADGCDPSRPVGYLEGWYVSQPHRRRGLGRQLMRAAEDWAREQGCIEMASDTWIDSAVSQQAHEALGFEVVDRVVNYRKAL